MVKKSAWYLYIARCQDNSLYIGISSDVKKRIERHNLGLGCSWIKEHGKARIVYTEKYPSYLETLYREKQLKKWSRIKKENLIRSRKS